MEFNSIATHDTWRLIPWLEASGEVQMAIDSWLLEQHRLGKHPPHFTILYLATSSYFFGISSARLS